MKNNIDSILKPETLTANNFAEFGKIISIEESDSILINDGYAQKYSNLCDMDSNEKNGVSSLHIYVAKKREFPLDIYMLEKHPFFSQTFIPKSQNPFLLVVALGKDKPDLETLKVFKTNGNQGIHYLRDIWHFPLISLYDNEHFIVIDRNDLGKVENKIKDCIEIKIDKKIKILKE